MQSQSTPTVPDPVRVNWRREKGAMQRRQPLLPMALLCPLFWGLLTFLLSAHITLAQARIQTGTTPTTAFLQVDDHVLLDRPGFHLSKPLLSPDGRWLAVTVVPTGVSTASLAETYLFAMATAQLVVRLPTHSPSWSADSLQLSTENGEGTFVYHLPEQRLEQTSMQARRGDNPSLFPLPRLPLVYPQTIRVIHHASNGCRNVPVGQIDVIPFEAYVAGVVPAEVPATWPAAALEAMAVAARTYAWQQILAGRHDYDVSDWANYQVMCDARYASTDSAVTATAGQYLTAKTEASGLPISAMYSAENGHPTLTNPNVTYLQAVPDLFALGRERWGHGYGLSQWGAYRRAQAGQNYRQILGHYYSKVYLQNGQDPTLATGGLTGILPQTALATDSLYLSALVPADAAARMVITASAGVTASVALPGSEAIWRAAQPLPENTIVTAQLWLHDHLHDQVTLSVDHTPPAAPLFQLSAVLTQPVADVAFPTVADVTPLLYPGWAWQGEELRHTANSGSTIADAQAADGVAWQARVGSHQPGVWYGPYTPLLPAGYNYRALFWLRAGSGLTADPADHVVARLDVTDEDGEQRLGLRDLWTSDFLTTDHYTPIAVDFHLFTAPRGLEFRVAWPGKVDLALDRVEIWRLPSSDDGTSFDLPFSGQMGVVAIGAAQMDSAGNLSEVVSRTTTLLDLDPPQIGSWPLSTGWQPTATLTVSVAVTDSFSGIDREQGQFVLAQYPHTRTVSATFPIDKLPWQRQVMTGALVDLTDGVYTVHLHLVDRAGNVREQAYPLRIDTQPPTVTHQVFATPSNGWYGEPVTLVLTATDRGSGVAQLDYTLTTAAASGVSQPYTQPILLNTAGIYTVTYGATDQAGNITPRQTLTAALDLAAPVVLLQQYPLRTNTVRLAWQISDDGTGVALVEMEVQQGDGAWQAATWDPFAVTTADIDLDAETSTRVRVRAQDHFGHLSDWVTIDLQQASAWIYLPLVQQ